MKTKLTKDTVPDGFTLSLALIDALPVLFFGGTMILLSFLLRSPLFFAGSFLALWAGLAKVLWKMIVVLKKKNVWWLFIQMRIVMPLGLLLMIPGLAFAHSTLPLSSLLSMPSLALFALGLVGMVLMGIFAFRLDGSRARSNWIEQITNAIAQLCFFFGVLFLF